jgi:hypothetical protein
VCVTPTQSFVCAVASFAQAHWLICAFCTGTPAVETPDVKTAPPAAPAAPEGGPPEAQTPSAIPPAAAEVTPAEQPVDGAVKTEEKPAADAADAALDQKMAQEDKPRLIQARTTLACLWHDR